MFSKLLTLTGVALSLTIVPFSLGPALGHHSLAMFDLTQTESVTGTVTMFQMLNPHSWLYVTATDENGNERSWAFESSSPSGLVANGWAQESLNEGDRVVVSFNPMRDGTNGGQLRSVLLPDGTELCSGQRCRDIE